MTFAVVDPAMKRDGRSLDHKTLEEIRWMAVQREREGERPADVIEAYGFHRTSIYKWLRMALRPGGGLRMLKSTPAIHLVLDSLPAHKTALVKQIH